MKKDRKTERENWANSRGAFLSLLAIQALGIAGSVAIKKANAATGLLIGWAILTLFIFNSARRDTDRDKTASQIDELASEAFNIMVVLFAAISGLGFWVLTAIRAAGFISTLFILGCRITLTKRG